MHALKRTAALPFIVMTLGCNVESDRVGLSTTSPAGAEIHVLGDLQSTPRIPGVANVLRARIAGRPNVPPLPIFFADQYESAFQERYPNHGWVEAHVLRFNAKVERRDSRIQVENASSAPVALCRVTALDLVLVVDLERGGAVEVRAAAAGGEIGVQAVFADGRLVGPAVLQTTASKDGGWRVRITDAAIVSR
ncbi:MAG TPA: hypothetical protein VM364_21565 [Vicinamibacterales bacterium]|nr:hypothetical protein [Vicinamibacterales bacterium]